MISYVSLLNVENFELGNYLFLPILECFYLYDFWRYY